MRFVIAAFSATPIVLGRMNLTGVAFVLESPSVGPVCARNPVLTLSAIYQRLAPILVAWQMLATTLGPGMHVLPGTLPHACEHAACHSTPHHNDGTIVRSASRSVAHDQANCVICKWLTQANAGSLSSALVSRPALLGRGLPANPADVPRVWSRLALPRAPPA